MMSQSASSTTTQPKITESQILTSYLLTPSPLTTLLPYKTFLTLLPTTYLNNPSNHHAIKFLYRDLQFQRDITLAQVSENIDRECTSQAATLRANLARRIAIEEGEIEADELDDYNSAYERESGRSRKRRRIESHDSSSSPTSSASSPFQPPTTNTNLRTQTHHTATTTFLSTPSKSTSHPAAHPSNLPFPLPTTMLLAQISQQSKSKSNFHSRLSLLHAMSDAEGSLDEEIGELEREIEGLKGEVREVVGGLSDLRYGKVRKRRGGEEGEEMGGGSGYGGVDGDGEYADVLDALRQFRGVLRGDVS